MSADPFATRGNRDHFLRANHAQAWWEACWQDRESAALPTEEAKCAKWNQALPRTGLLVLEEAEVARAMWKSLQRAWILAEAWYSGTSVWRSWTDLVRAQSRQHKMPMTGLENHTFG